MSKSNENAGRGDLGSPLELYMRGVFTYVLVGMTRTLATNQLSVAQLATLHLLDTRGAHRLSDLAEELGFSLPTASRMVSDLVDRSLAYRTEDPNDRRARRIALSPAGRALMDQVSRERIESGERALGALDGEVAQPMVELFVTLQQRGLATVPPVKPKGDEA